MKLCKSCREMLKSGRVLFDPHCICNQNHGEGLNE